MSGWQHTTLGALCRFVGGQGFPPEYQGLSHGDVPFIKVSDMELPPNGRRITTANNWLTGESLAAGRFKPQPSGAIVFAKIGEAIKRERVRVLTRPTVIDNNMMAAIPEAVDSEFLFNLLRFIPFSKDHGGTSLPYLRQGDLAKIEAFVPPLEEQERIAGVLGAFDDLIETNRRLVAQIREVVTSAWARALSNGPVEMPFFDAFDVRFGAPFGGSEFAPSGVGRPLIRIRDLKTLSPDTWTTQSRPDETVIEPGDVLVGMDAEFVPTYWLGASGVLNQRVMRVKSPYGGAGLCCEALRDPMAFVQGYKTGTTVAHLNKADLQTLTVRIPEDRSRAVFNEATKGLVKAVVGLAQESDDLVQQRDELLPLLMSGKVRVRDVEAAVS